ncbi:unnamed protein product [Rhodiola kirilowii]
MAALTSATPTVGLAETFTRLKEQGKVAFIPYITASDPDLSTTAKALKVLLIHVAQTLLRWVFLIQIPWKTVLLSS